MDNKTEAEQLREEFYSKIADFTDDDHHDVEPYSMQKIADFWLNKISDQKARLVGEIKNLENYYRIEGIDDDLLKKKQVLEIINKQ